MPKQVLQTNKPCLRKAKNQLEKHQMGFDGEHIGQDTLEKKLKRKNPTITVHKHKFDILTDREAWEVKTVGLDAEHKMSVKAEQKIKKLAWAKKHKKKPKSMMIIVNNAAEVYIRDGLGEFRAGGMKRVARYKDWRKEVGHGRMERLVKGAPTRRFKDKTMQETYEKYRQKYDKWRPQKFSLGNINETRELSEEAKNMIRTWQLSTTESTPTALKSTIGKYMSRKVPSARVAEKITRDPYLMSELKDRIERMGTKSYKNAIVRLQALTDAKNAVMKTKTITVYRGVGGRTGKKLKEQAKNLKKLKGDKGVVRIKQDALVSYTTDIEKAKKFGRGGVVIKQEVPVNEIFFDARISSLEQMMEEKEVILYGSDRTLSIGDIIWDF